MDAKIKKYARWCELSAWALMAWSILQWIGMWVADWIMYSILKLPSSYFDSSKYASLNEALANMSGEQLRLLHASEAGLKVDFGGAWIGLANLAKLSWQYRLLGFLCDGIAVGILMVGFWFFIKLMQELKKGSLFSGDVIAFLNKLAKVIFGFALYAPVNRVMINLILELQNPPGHRIWAFLLNVSVGDLFLLATSGFFMLLTALMHESRQLQEEKDLTV